MTHPIILLCRVIPAEPTEATSEFIDKLHLVFSATKVYHSKDRDEATKLIYVLRDIGLVDLATEGGGSPRILIKQSNLAKRIIQEYGN